MKALEKCVSVVTLGIGNPVVPPDIDSIWGILHCILHAGSGTGLSQKTFFSL